MVAQTDNWNGIERRQMDRRKAEERRAEERTIFDRRSGQDRRGHPLYGTGGDREIIESEVE